MCYLFRSSDIVTRPATLFQTQIGNYNDFACSPNIQVIFICASLSLHVSLGNFKRDIAYLVQGRIERKKNHDPATK